MRLKPVAIHDRVEKNMTSVLAMSLIVCPILAGPLCPSEDRWYDNPLGFSPLEHHARNGFILPALAVGVCLLLTRNDAALTDRLAFFSEGGVSWGYKYPNTILYQDNAGLELQLRRWMSVGTDLGLYFPRDAFNKTSGVAARLFARFYPVNNERWRVYFESGAGLICFKDEYPMPTDQDPRRGTSWNGTTKYGLGGAVNINRSIAFMFGLRHIHVSNGNVKGVERNPSHDSNGFFIGLSVRPIKASR